jgi:hypothetical protein
MRNQFIPTPENAQEGQESAATLEAAKQVAPWAAVIVEVDGGWHAFESHDDYDTWCKQV